MGYTVVKVPKSGALFCASLQKNYTSGKISTSWELPSCFFLYICYNYNYNETRAFSMYFPMAKFKDGSPGQTSRNLKEDNYD